MRADENGLTRLTFSETLIWIQMRLFMRFTGPALAVVLLVSSSSVYARDVQVGNTTVTVEAPFGFCELDKTKTFDSSWQTSATNLLKASSIQLIAGFPNCKELQQARSSGQLILNKFFVSAYEPVIANASAASTTETCNQIRAMGDYSAETKSVVQDAVKKYSSSTSLDSKLLGILEEVAGQVCYVATLQKIKTNKGEVVTLLVLIAITSVRTDLIYLYLNVPYADASSIPGALADLKVLYSDFAAANK
jgi:hypothetical protein